ncbi:MAG: hypothetical protein M4579_002480 [Chaenotheca gracillima]|nr:MAG: hypothetical protein M4579_002480 [Chaenotheca gracillima]
MAPIRVAIIGLSTSSNAGMTGAWAVNAHLPYLRASPDYEIVALCNSTVESAQKSIAHHGFGPDTKAYGNPEDLAKDPNVDLVVVSVRVDRHYHLVKPSVEAGKDIFVEWPLGSNTKEAEELTNIARAKGSKTAVGLQSRTSLVGVKVKELIDSGRIGKVQSSVASMTFPGLASSVMPESIAYFADSSVGGNALTIPAGHFIDHANFILGEFTELNATFVNQFPTIDVVNDAGEVVRSNVKKDVPDLVNVQGVLVNNVAFSFSLRIAHPVDGKAVRWLISGTEGEIEITCPVGMWQFSPPGITVRVCKKDGKDVEDIPVEADPESEIGKLGFLAHNPARIYEAFAKGETDKYATFEDAVVRHRMVDAIWESGHAKAATYKSSY